MGIENHFVAILNTKMADGSHLVCFKLHGSEMARNVIKSDFRSSKATVTPVITTSYDDLRWVNFGNRGPSGGERPGVNVCNRATLHDVAAIRGHRPMSWEFL